MRAWWMDPDEAPRAGGRAGLLAVVVLAVLGIATDAALDPKPHILVGMAPGAEFGIDACGTPVALEWSDAWGIVEFVPPAGSCAGGGVITVSRATQGVRARCHVRER